MLRRGYGKGTIGRLNGDYIVSQTGNKKAVLAGCLLAALGFAFVVLTMPFIWLSLLGYVIIGFGCSCIVPVLFRASANIPGLNTVEGFAMVTSGGLIGFLAGPSVIGFISEKSGLSIALSLLILMTLLAATVAWRNRFLLSQQQLHVEEIYDEQLY